MASKKNTGLPRQPKFLILVSELSSARKRSEVSKDTESGKSESSKIESFLIEESKAFVEAHIEAAFREIAAQLDCALPSVGAALKQIQVT
ncbi:hypothetical protein [Streptococcus pseudopneumoniae]|uniref:hypothetical protein n=1 Tax=Streptococcus pseudopneumoniae TaxID=257758 RepID=UPI0015D54469|nr:hypothetical protein [Streptococcus pseudopneumoniae]